LVDLANDSGSIFAVEVPGFEVDAGFGDFERFVETVVGVEVLGVKAVSEGWALGFFVFFKYWWEWCIFEVR
jgi:hypothetical protein